MSQHTPSEPVTSNDATNRSLTAVILQEQVAPAVPGPFTDQVCGPGWSGMPGAVMAVLAPMSGSRSAPRRAWLVRRRRRRSLSAAPAWCAASAWRWRCGTGTSASTVSGVAWSPPTARNCARLLDSAVTGRQMLIHSQFRRFYRRNDGCGQRNARRAEVIQIQEGSHVRRISRAGRAAPASIPPPRCVSPAGYCLATSPRMAASSIWDWPSALRAQYAITFSTPPRQQERARQSPSVTRLADLHIHR